MHVLWRAVIHLRVDNDSLKRAHQASHGRCESLTGRVARLAGAKSLQRDDTIASAKTGRMPETVTV